MAASRTDTDDTSNAQWRAEVLFDAELSVLARLLLLALDVMNEATVVELKDELGVGDSAIRTAVKELLKTDMLLAERRGNEPIRYKLNEGSSRARARATHGFTSKDRNRSLVEVEDTNQSQTLQAPVIRTPKLLKIEKRNLGWDAIAEVCEIAERSPRTREIPAALNGGKSGLGIREQFWLEVCEHYGTESIIAILKDEPERFERALAQAINTRAQVYRQAMPPGSMLTPPALQKWWSDLPKMRKQGDNDLLARMREEADRLRKEGN